ncbi:MAG: hypothetical protein ACI9CF_000104 [Candidatus Omnitrophota bacterium]|jgi:hypothetical protein
MKKKQKTTLLEKAKIAMKKAVREALKDHAKHNDDVYIFRDGKVQKIAAKKLLD